MGLQLVGKYSTVATTVEQPLRLSAAPPPPPTPSLAPGFRFHPTDEELVTYYLRRKVCGKSLRFQPISEIDLYKCEPWQLDEFSSLRSRDQEWYFFSAIDKKYEHGSRLNRATRIGYWKATGRDRDVHHKNEVIGMKKTLVFHMGRAPDGKRTNWVMHEYRLACQGSANYGVVEHAFVLCRIFLKSGLGAPNGNRYAPFVEEEWDDDNATLVVHEDEDEGEGEVEEEMITGDGMPVKAKNFEQGINPMTNKVNAKCHNFAIICKRGKSVAELEPFSASQLKRSKPDDPSSSNANGFGDSTTINDDFHHKTTKNVYPTLMGFPLFDTLEPKRTRLVDRPTLDSSNLDKSVPPGYLKFISNLEDEIINVSRERETLKLELLRANTIINTLQSRIVFLGMENEDLKTKIQCG
ncbi:hypothetical protein LIER_19636 [Lithospermum erythrorhizon]|uniref:NAC domain-containing protein n=1 Tax=Lithospermum erythrorhizon TaxID=34254 RepID=A0AAV3QM93_LITER